MNTGESQSSLPDTAHGQTLQLPIKTPDGVEITSANSKDLDEQNNDMDVLSAHCKSLETEVGARSELLPVLCHMAYL